MTVWPLAQHYTTPKRENTHAEEVKLSPRQGLHDHGLLWPSKQSLCAMQGPKDKGSSHADRHLASCLILWQCDLGRPSCGQCQRIAKDCHGYRDSSNLIVHNQTTHISRKVQRAKRPSQSSSAELVREPPPIRSFRAREHTSPELSHLSAAPSPIFLYLPPSLDHQAFYSFFSNYACRPSKNFTNIYEKVPALYLKSPTESTLVSTITALGLAGLACHTSTYGLETTADISYNKALRQLNQTLRDPELAKDDLTLLVVLLLGLYEVRSPYLY